MKGDNGPWLFSMFTLHVGLVTQYLEIGYGMKWGLSYVWIEVICFISRFPSVN